MSEAHGVGVRLGALEALGFEHGSIPCSETETLRFGRDTWRTTRTTLAMGTRVSTVVLGGSPSRTEEATGRAFQEMTRLVGVLSRFDSSSAIAYFNDVGEFRDPPPELTHVVSESVHYHMVSRGAFDITVAPVVDLYRTGGGFAPTAAATAEAMELVGAQHIAMSNHRLKFERLGMWITLDGIAKGYIVDSMAHELERYGIRRHLIEAGGDIRTAGTNQSGEPWRIAVRDPSGPGIILGTIRQCEGAVATSGGYENYFGTNLRFHHIVNGTTGTCPTCASVSVTAPTAMAADALATGTFVMDPESAIGLIESIPGCACLVIDSHGNHRTSTGWRFEVESS